MRSMISTFLVASCAASFLLLLAEGRISTLGSPSNVPKLQTLWEIPDAIVASNDNYGNYQGFAAVEENRLSSSGQGRMLITFNGTLCGYRLPSDSSSSGTPTAQWCSPNTFESLRRIDFLPQPFLPTFVCGANNSESSMFYVVDSTYGVSFYCAETGHPIVHGNLWSSISVTSNAVFLAGTSNDNEIDLYKYDIEDLALGFTSPKWKALSVLQQTFMDGFSDIVATKDVGYVLGYTQVAAFNLSTGDFLCLMNGASSPLDGNVYIQAVSNIAYVSFFRIHWYKYHIDARNGASSTECTLLKTGHYSNSSFVANKPGDLLIEVELNPGQKDRYGKTKYTNVTLHGQSFETNPPLNWTQYLGEKVLHGFSYAESMPGNGEAALIPEVPLAGPASSTSWGIFGGGLTYMSLFGLRFTILSKNGKSLSPTFAMYSGIPTWLPTSSFLQGSTSGALEIGTGSSTKTFCSSTGYVTLQGGEGGSRAPLVAVDQSAPAVFCGNGGTTSENQFGLIAQVPIISSSSSGGQTLISVRAVHLRDGDDTPTTTATTGHTTQSQEKQRKKSIPRVTPHGWKKIRPLTLEEKTNVTTSSIPILITLKRKTMDKVRSTILEDLSNPSSPRFGSRLSFEEIRHLSGGPSDRDLDKVLNWLNQGEAPSIKKKRTFASSPRSLEITVSHTKDSLSFTATPWQLEKLFPGLEFAWYQRTGRGKEKEMRVIRSSTSTVVPNFLQGLIRSVVGHEQFPDNTQQKKKSEKLAANPSNPFNETVTPKVIREAYNQTVFPTLDSSYRNIQAFFELQGSWTDLSDVQSFCQQFLNTTSGTPSSVNCDISHVVGTNARPSGEGYSIESSLDAEYLISTGGYGGVETWIVGTHMFNFCDALLNLTHAVRSIARGEGGDHHYPFVISISYNSQSPFVCGSGDELEEEFALLSVMGITVVAASGDYGSGEYGGSSAISGYNFGTVTPGFPASIPWILSVGSTRFVEGNSGTQRATDVFGSGGGFSFQFQAQEFQLSALQRYADNEGGKSGISPPFASRSWNLTGRGTPDISALGSGFEIVVNGKVQFSGGTSASTPTVAGLISQLNTIRLNSQNKTMGFILPWLYGLSDNNQTSSTTSTTTSSSPPPLTNIAMGDNDVGRDQMGWLTSSEGWDPVTGLGTPNFGVLAELVEQMKN